MKTFQMLVNVNNDGISDSQSIESVICSCTNDFFIVLP